MVVRVFAHAHSPQTNTGSPQPIAHLIHVHTRVRFCIVNIYNVMQNTTRGIAYHTDIALHLSFMSTCLVWTYMCVSLVPRPSKEIEKRAGTHCLHIRQSLPVHRIFLVYCTFL